jgi:hypothetical protein
LAEFWYNTSFHSALNHTPFEVLYGHQPRHFSISVGDVCRVPELDQWLQERVLMSQVIKQHLLRAQVPMKTQADKRIEVSFEVGDKVFLKLQPYMQSSLAPISNQKLPFKYFGPFTILEKVGSVAYKLNIPESSSVHPVFHVSLLKRMVSPEHKVCPLLPDSFILSGARDCIADVHRGDIEVAQVLIKWSHIPVELATW